MTQPNNAEVERAKKETLEMAKQAFANRRAVDEWFRDAAPNLQEFAEMARKQEREKDRAELEKHKVVVEAARVLVMAYYLNEVNLNSDLTQQFYRLAYALRALDEKVGAGDE